MKTLKPSLALLFILFCLIFTGCARELKSDGENAVVAAVVNDVEYKEPESENWEKAHKGMKVKAGTDFRTNADGKISIKAPGDSIVRVNSATDFAYGGNARGTVTFDLRRGGILAKVKNHRKTNGAAFIIRTPHGHAGVRGTEFYVKHYDKTEVFVLEGSVFVRHAIKKELELTVEKGFKTSVEKFAGPTEHIKYDLEKFKKEELKWAEELKALE